MLAARVGLLFVIAAGIVEACAPPLPPGGNLVAKYESESAAATGEASARFYASVDGDPPSTDPWSAIRSGECDDVPASNASYTYVPADVGDAIHLERGTDVVTLSKSSSGGVVEYRSAALSGADLAPGESWDVAFTDPGGSGTVVWTGSLVMPRVPQLTAPAGINDGEVSILGNGALRIAFPAAGAEEAYVVFHGDTDRACRIPADAQSFDVPATEIARLPREGTMEIVLLNVTHETLSGNDVDVQGEVHVRATFRRYGLPASVVPANL